MPISFDRIPANVRRPGVYAEIDNSRALRGVQLLQYDALLIGQKLSAGTAATLLPVRVTSAEQARQWFGAGSMLLTMVEAALATGMVGELWCQPLADNQTGTAAVGGIAFAGSPTKAGTVTLYIGGRRVQMSAATDDTATALATRLADAVNANAALEVTAAVDGAMPERVNLTARHRGLGGNTLGLHVGYFGESLPAGLSVTVTAMTGGAGNPDLSAAMAVWGDQWFQVIAMPYTDATNLTALENELADRFGPQREIEGQAFAAANASHAALGTLGGSRNSPHVTLVAAYAEPMPVYAKAAETAALAAHYASIDPARPLQDLPYRYCLPPLETGRFTDQERELLLFDGIATTWVDRGGVMRTERLITTYKTNTAGGADTSYLDVETLFTLMTLRHDWRNTIQQRYPRYKLAGDGTRFGPGQAVVTPNVMKAEAIAKFGEWEALGLVENADQYKRDVVVERHASDPNRLDVLLPPDLINGLRVVANKIQFRL